MRSKKQKRDSTKTSTKRREQIKRLEHEGEGAAGGVLAGGIVGAAAGPPGIIAGAILGGAAGAVAGRAMDGRAAADAAHMRELDATIGVSGGDMGAPNLEHPPATIGAYSSASAGMEGTAEADAAPAEGPLEVPKD